MLKCCAFFISVDGGFSDWTLEGNCSVTCGDGIQNRVRFCNNATPAHGGRERQGPERDIVPCTLSTCLIKSVAMLTIERNITNPDRTVPTVAVDVNHDNMEVATIACNHLPTPDILMKKETSLFSPSMAGLLSAHHPAKSTIQSISHGVQ